MLSTLTFATFLTIPSPIQAGYVYNFTGCGYLPNTQAYFAAYEDKEHYQEFFYGTSTDANGCFHTPDAVWVWGPGVFDVDVLQARPGHRLHRVLATEVLAE